ncbi:response regulator [Paenibacillus sp. NPDC057886]|uniref:response regulator n=1 Tax=Paenibacillus sp. NPDC057886 TaxID=3346270 RepID=UPI00367E798E
MKIILVDDEKGILEGLKKMVSRYIPECEVVGTAHNGIDGFNIIQKWQPDIVITDIRMPQANGLEMIKMLKDMDSQSKFILLSGYADFEYARRGMQLGVNFYINKPVEERELRECVCLVMESIRSERMKLHEIDNMKQDFQCRIQEEALRDILDLGNDHMELVEELLRVNRIYVKDSKFASILIEMNANVDFLKEYGFDPVFRQIDLTLRQYDGVYRFRYSGSQIAVVITHNATLETGELVRAIHRLNEALTLNLKLSIVIGVGTVKNRPTGISQSFEEARNALSYKLIKGTASVIPFSEIMNLAVRSKLVPEELISALEAAIDNMDEHECVVIIHEIFGGIADKPTVSPVDLQLQCLNILLMSIRKMSIQQLQQNELIGRHILSLEGISRFETLAYLEEWMVQVIHGIIAFKLENHISKKKVLISEIKEYVTDHYNEPISLAEVATHFFINPYYLSQYFKQKTGETYLNFLTQIRVSKAKELLENTDMKIYEICHEVGYSDPQHFARMFEKLTGSKPREYRKNLTST